jgi:tetratricopeptide (TPR) repeat protein
VNRTCPALLLLAGAIFASPPALATCTLGRLAELPVTMLGLKPVLEAKINDQDVRLVADTGAAYSVLTPAAAARLNLRLEHAALGFSLEAVGGSAELWVTRVKTFKLINAVFHDVGFLVAGNDLGEGLAGVLGQNLFSVGDVEYDLAHGVIRLFRPHDCGKANFAYWTRETAQSASGLELEYTDPKNPQTLGAAYVNGARMRVLFDTGGGESALSLDAAKRAGITPQTAGVVSTGGSYGMGRHVVRTWVAPVSSFRIADEEIKSTRLEILETLPTRVDVLLGADFFLSHRIFVSNSAQKMFFTYNGGPVFRLPAATAEPAAPAAGVAAAATAAGAAAPAPHLNEPTDAAGYARRGSASAARHDYAQALSDLNRACELAPTESGYFYQRAMAHLGAHEADAALQDLDQVLQLRPDDLEALLAGAQLRLDRQDPAAAALADLDAADRAAPRESDERIRLGDLYQRAGNYQAAVRQYSSWIDAHPHGDISMPRALTARCWAGVRWGQELDKGLGNCAAALDVNPVAAHDGRGYIYLQRGEFDQAIVDFDAALRANPRRASALYGRGVARQRAGKSGGQADIAAATDMDRKVTERAAEIGIRP